MELSIKFKFDRSTKGAHLFKEVNDAGEPMVQHDAAVGSLYVRRSAMPKAPDQLLVTVAWDGL